MRWRTVPFRAQLLSNQEQSQFGPRTFCEILTEPSDGPQKGVHYISASEQKIPNKGQKKVEFRTKGGRKLSLMF